MKRPSHSRGFTLIELMVALAMGLAVTTAALTVLLMVIDTQREGQKRNALTRDAQLAMDAIGHDLSYLGVGVPRGYESDNGGNVVGTIDDPATSRAQLRPAVRIARVDNLAFLGDLPYVHSDFNGIVQPSMLRGNPTSLGAQANGLSVLSELSGCAPGANCDTTLSTVNLMGSDCTSGAEPSCPWGLRKWTDAAGPMNVVVGSYDGRWWRRRVAMGGGGVPTTATDSGRLMIQLDADIPNNAFIGPRNGGGFISHLDRIFYSVEAIDGGACTELAFPAFSRCVLRRKHCWQWDIATLNPNASDFPALNAGPKRSSATDIGSCDPAATNPQGTPWEVIAQDVQSLQFQYYDATGTQLNNTGASLAELARVRTIRVVLTLARDLGRNKPLSYQLTRQFHLENAGGIVSLPETTNANGGCWDTASGGPANECNPQ